MKLGRKPGQSGPKEIDADKEYYPGFSLQDEHAKAFMKSNPMKIGDEFHAHVKLRVNSMSASEHGHSMGFDVMEMNDPGETEAAKQSEMMRQRPTASVMQQHMAEALRKS